MNETTLNKLNSLAEDQSIRLWYACESGSRAWGFPCPDSDFDIRFLYTNLLEWYLRIEEGRDVCEVPMEGLLDMGGWELRKALRLAKKSNPVLWEWFQSPTRYFEKDADFLPELRSVVDPYYSPIAAANHYLALCKGTMERELTGPTVKIKKYFYMLRPILAAQWIVDCQTIPPMEFEPLLDGVRSNHALVEAIRSLQERKKITDEKVGIDRISFLETYLQTTYADLKGRATLLSSGKGSADDVEAFFRRRILEGWHRAHD